MKKYFWSIVRVFVFGSLMLSVMSCDESESEGRVKASVSCPNKQHEHAIDLGLSVKWACCNVGASSPEEYGGYYAWGETEEKSEYWGDNSYKWFDERGHIIKYCTDRHYGIVDDKVVLELEDDVAHVKWGDMWRMPTQKEIQELCNQCTWVWSTLKGVEGYKVTGPNGNSIFLPAAGCRHDTEVYGPGSSGSYWSATLCDDEYAYDFEFYYDGDYFDSYTFREWGYSVRPVKD